MSRLLVYNPAVVSTNGQDVDIRLGQSSQKSRDIKSTIDLLQNGLVVEYASTQLVKRSLDLELPLSLSTGLLTKQSVESEFAQADFESGHAMVLGLSDSLVKRVELRLAAKDLSHTASND